MSRVLDVPAARVADGSSRTTGSRSLRIRPLDAPLGAEVTGLDLGRPLADDAFASIVGAHLDRHVLVFRDQRITPDQQIAFGKLSGGTSINEALLSGSIDVGGAGTGPDRC